MTERKSFIPKIALMIGAHADDIDFVASGAVAKWSKQGTEVHYLILTDGSKGSEDQQMTPKRLIEMRQKEQREAAATLGAKDVHFLGYEDAMLK